MSLRYAMLLLILLSSPSLLAQEDEPDEALLHPDIVSVTLSDEQTAYIVPVYLDVLHLDITGEIEETPLIDTCETDNGYLETLLDDSEELEAYQEIAEHIVETDVLAVIETALIEASEYLLEGDVLVCIYPLRPANDFVRDEMYGISGHYWGDTMFLNIDVSDEDWATWLKYTVAHEYHHIVVDDNSAALTRNGWTLLDTVVAEGAADSFAQNIYPDLLAPWSDALSVEQEIEMWDYMTSSNRLVLTGYRQISSLIFGNDNFPQWTGYTIGYHIVQAYLENNPEATIEEWSYLVADELLEASGYDPADNQEP